MTTDGGDGPPVRLGARPDSAEAEGKVREARRVAVTREQVEAILARFCGDILQVPPMHSALKRDGRPLYEYARKGIELERAPRAVTIHSLDLRSFEGDRIDFDVDCSKGTYVRTLAQDIGEALGCGGHLTALRRTRIGSLHLEEAFTLDALEALSPAAREVLLQPADALLTTLPRLDLNADAAQRFGHGQAVQAKQEPPAGKLRVYADDGRFLGLGRAAPDGLVAPARLVATPLEK